MSRAQIKSDIRKVNRAIEREKKSDRKNKENELKILEARLETLNNRLDSLVNSPPPPPSVVFQTSTNERTHAICNAHMHELPTYMRCDPARTLAHVYTIVLCLCLGLCVHVCRRPHP